jgi:hypothetical protein
MMCSTRRLVSLDGVKVVSYLWIMRAIRTTRIIGLISIATFVENVRDSEDRSFPKICIDSLKAPAAPPRT